MPCFKKYIEFLKEVNPDGSVRKNIRPEENQYLYIAVGNEAAFHTTAFGHYMESIGNAFDRAYLYGEPERIYYYYLP